MRDSLAHGSSERPAVDTVTFDEIAVFIVVEACGTIERCGARSLACGVRHLNMGVEHQTELKNACQQQDQEWYNQRHFDQRLRARTPVYPMMVPRNRILHLVAPGSMRIVLVALIMI